MPLDAEEKEKRRKKQFKRMGKILGKAWNLTEVFQDCDSSEVAVGNLSDIGQKLDEQDYRVGRHGWEDFARDLGGVYNRHVKRYAYRVCACSMDETRLFRSRESVQQMMEESCSEESRHCC